MSRSRCEGAARRISAREISSGDTLDLDRYPCHTGRAFARPAVGQQLDHAQALTRLERGRDQRSAEVITALGLEAGVGWAVDEVVHRALVGEETVDRADGTPARAATARVLSRS